jgi:hypothetical protein
MRWALVVAAAPIKKALAARLPAAVKAFTRRFRGEEHDVLDDTDRRILYDLVTP